MADSPSPSNGSEMAVDIVARITSLVTGMKESAEAVQVSSAEMVESLSTVAETAEAVMAPLIAIAALAEGGELFKEAVVGVVELATQLDVLHQKTGIEVEELSRLKYAADLSHVSAEQLTIGLQRLSRAMEEAAKGGSNPAADAFQLVGVRATEANGQLRPMEDVLLDLAQKFSEMPDGPTKTALAMDLFGRSGAALIPFLDRGRSGIQELREEADRLGATMSGQDVAAALEYEEAMKRLHAVWSSFVRTLVIDVLPILEKIVQTFQALIYLVEAAGWAVVAAGDNMILNFAGAQAAAEKMVAALKKIPEAYKERTPAQADKGGGNDQPIIHAKETVTAMERFRDEWNHIKADTDEGFVNMNALEALFWVTKLNTVKEGSKEYIEIYNRIADLKKGQDKESFDAQLEAMKASEALDKEHLDWILEDRRAELAFIRQHYSEMTKEVQEGIRRVNEAQAALTKQTEDQWKNVFKALPEAWKQTVSSMQKTGGTFGQFMRDIVTSMVKDFVVGEYQMLSAHAAAWLTKRKLTVEAVTEKVVMEAWAALKVIGMYAAEAAAGAWAAMVGIPFVGPFLAPAAAAAALAGVISLASNIRSAAGGFDIPSGLNPVTQLHAQEMVLPADLANRVRSMTGGGGGGETHLHVHAMDSADVMRFMHKNRNSVAAAAHAAARDGISFRNLPGRV